MSRRELVCTTQKLQSTHCWFPPGTSPGRGTVTPWPPSPWPNRFPVTAADRTLTQPPSFWIEEEINITYPLRRARRDRGEEWCQARSKTYPTTAWGPCPIVCVFFFKGHLGHLPLRPHKSPWWVLIVLRASRYLYNSACLSSWSLMWPYD